MQKLVTVNEALKNPGVSTSVNELTHLANGNKQKGTRIVCVLLHSHYF